MEMFRGMSYAFHPEAEAELVGAIAYYNECQPGLGQDFAVETYAVIERILAYPKAWPVLEEDVRRCQTSRFPYGVLYAIDGDLIFILTVMHLHREPEYWKHRHP